MKLYVTHMAPNPERVLAFVREKGITDLEILPVDLMQGEHRKKSFREKSPFAQVPVLELDDGRTLTESRAISRYLEGLYPDPNLFGTGPEETAFIEMWDRRVEFMWLLALAWWLRHGHPAFKALEKQIPELSERGEKGFRRFARVLDGQLADHAFIAGDRFSIADITAWATIGFARVARWKPDPEKLPNLVRWRDDMLARPCGAKD